MRRFLTTGVGKTFCHFIAVAIALPFISFLSVTRAEAQIQIKPQWAVVPFVNGQPGNGAADYGNQASQAIYDELAKSNEFDLTPLDSVNRSIQDLGLQTPVTDATSLLRLAQALNVSTLVTGDLVGWRIDSIQGGKQATVGMKVRVVDVASGLPINGAGVKATSPVRASNTSQDDLIKDALAQGAAQAVSSINSQTLPTATILNTRISEGLINRGSRDGFQDGQTVIVTRGREEVATARVFGVEPDSANVKLIRQIKGIQPGDRVRVVFQVPDVVISGGRSGNGGNIRIVEPSKPINSAGIISAALVLGFAAFILGGGRANNNQGVSSVVAEAGNFTSTNVANGIRISWTRDLFYANNRTAAQFLVYRSDAGSGGFDIATAEPFSPNAGQQLNNYAWDLPGTHNLNVALFQPQISSLTCAPLGLSGVAAAGPTAGNPNLYQVALVYSTPAQTGTGLCYYATDSTTAVGLSTVLNNPAQETPIPDQSVTSYVPFQFTSTGNGVIAIGYVVQIAANPLFTGTVITSSEKVTSDTTDQSISLAPRFTGDTFTQLVKDKFGAVSQVWWRVGCRNVEDNPGPLMDPATHLRYIFTPSQPIATAATAPPKLAKGAVRTKGAGPHGTVGTVKGQGKGKGGGKGAGDKGIGTKH